MSTDKIADLMTRIRNAQRAGHPTVSVPASKTKERVLAVLLDEGYIERVENLKDASDKPFLKIYLRYALDGRPAIQEIVRLSTPGRRRFVAKDKIPVHRGGLGTLVVSTSRGMMSDREARKQGVGGELVCSVF